MAKGLGTFSGMMLMEDHMDDIVPYHSNIFSKAYDGMLLQEPDLSPEDILWGAEGVLGF
jgi:hypothetical protein